MVHGLDEKRMKILIRCSRRVHIRPLVQEMEIVAVDVVDPVHRLLESGLFLMPGGSSDMSPPALIEEGKRYRIVEGRWAAEDSPNPSLAAPPASLTKEQLEAAARARRDFLLERAGLRMAPLSDAVDLGVATDAERTALAAWKAYRVQLNRVSGQTHYPAQIEWPVEPI